MQAILINTTFQLGHHGCTLVDRQLDEMARAAGLQFAAKLPLHADWDTAATTDFAAIIVNGEGGLHHDSSAARRIAQVPRWAQSVGKPAYLINTVYEANGPEVAAGIAQYRHVFTRDHLSRRELEAAKIAASLVPDLTLSWTPPDLPKAGRSVVVTDSTLRKTNAQLHAFANALGAHFLPLIARPPGPLEQGGDTRRWARFKARRLAGYLAPLGLWRDRWRGLIPEFDDFVIWLAQNAGLVIAGRFHAVCLALDLEIPVLAVPSNTWKIESLLSEVGLKNRIIVDLDDLQAKLAAGGLVQFAYSSEELDRIRNFRATARQKAVGMFTTIRQASQRT
jgi:hypothetical protein